MTQLIVIALIDAAVWGAWSTVAGYTGHRLPVRWIDQDRGFLRIRSCARAVAFYERWWLIRKWKRFLPEAGDVFKDGFHKRHLRSRDRAYFERFVVETRRAELTHYLMMVITPVFFWWNPLWLSLVMVVYAVIANVPCIAAQRYNRARLLRVLDKMDQKVEP